MEEKNKLIIFALAAHGEGISGGDRILMEFIKRWSKKIKTTVIQWEEGNRMFKRSNLVESENLKFQVVFLGFWCNLGFLICYLARIISGVWIGLSLKINTKENAYVYSASEFWMDSLPAAILKIRYPRLKWVATWFQTAPNPLQGFSETKRENNYRLNALLYWFSQNSIRPLITKYADLVLVNNEDERKQFLKLNKLGKLQVVLGAVDTEKISNYLKTHQSKTKKFDAVFQGRFHAQKGVVELVQIWQLVVKAHPNAQLAMIGDGPLIKDVKSEIRKLKLENNITLFGYLFDGDEKYQLFNSGKLVVHPAFYDSGGMAAAEAMAFGLPGVAFDLKSYKSYYPKGMLKVEVGNKQAFADKIKQLLKEDNLRHKVGTEARDMIFKDWSWDNRAEQVLQRIL